MALSVAIALVTVWVAIAASYETNYPVGFFVGSLSALWYALGALGGVAAREALDDQPDVHAPERPRSSHEHVIVARAASTIAL